MTEKEMSDLRIQQVKNEKDIEHVLYVIEKDIKPILSDILIQTKKTNGRVNKIESQIEILERNVVRLDEGTEDARFFQKHPNLFRNTIIAIGLNVIVTLSVMFVSINKFKYLIIPSQKTELNDIRK